MARLLGAERRRRGTLRGSRALSCCRQAVLGLRWFRDCTAPYALARDHGISRVTAYRYLDEVVAVLAAQPPELREAPKRSPAPGFMPIRMQSGPRPGASCSSRPQLGRFALSSTRLGTRCPARFKTSSKP